MSDGGCDGDEDEDEDEMRMRMMMVMMTMMLLLMMMMLLMMMRVMMMMMMMIRSEWKRPEVRQSPNGVRADRPTQPRSGCRKSRHSPLLRKLGSSCLGLACRSRSRGMG